MIFADPSRARTCFTKGRLLLACAALATLGAVAVSLAQAPLPQKNPLAESRQQAPADERVTLSAPSVKQGESLLITILHPRADLTAASAWLAGVKTPLFAQADGSLQGLAPVRVNQKPGRYAIKIQNPRGETIYEDAITVADGRYSRQNIVTTAKMGGLQPEPGELEAVGALKTATGPARYWQLPFLAPTPDCMNSPYGNLRYHNGAFTGEYHKGLDLRAPQGRPVRATTGGVVKIARFYRLHGGTVGIDHGQGVSSIYIHLSKILVTPGQRVNAGDTVGRVGATGFATGPHLHWGLFVNGLPVNPRQWAFSPAC
ncbi:MAG: M23 family metallopeptidase [Vampirovibrionales bacterium]|nr:M23 family metallopeptidase [Vampirovibrionales bacterium]